MKSQPQVLVVGAGPVGLMAAVRLASNGVPALVIDQRARISTHSYACALHPRSVELIASLGLADAAVRRGRSLDTVAFYEGQTRQAEVRLSDLTGTHPFALSLSQPALEDLLESRLIELTGDGAQRNRRLTSIRPINGGFVARIARVTDAGEGCLLANSVVALRDHRDQFFPFVIAADGVYSRVRDDLGIAFERRGKGVTCVVHEFCTDQDLPHEIRVMLDPRATSVFWPLSERRCRWTFELPPEMRAATSASLHVDLGASGLERLLRERAPWFDSGVRDMDWMSVAFFEPRLASVFCRDGCGLVGDAAHQTLPFGAQSMNVGLREAAELADAVTAAVGGDGEPLKAYAQERRREWMEHFTPAVFQPCYPGNAWAAERGKRILACLPESGPRLEPLLEQLGLRRMVPDLAHESAH